MLLPTESLFVNVHPYIDLGTGSMILQIAIASLISGLFMFKVFWGKTKLFLKKLFSRRHNG